MEIDEILKAKREEILRIAANHGASNVRIFGSVARGEANGQSDVDILVDMAPGHSLLDRAALLLDLQQALDCQVDVVTPQGLRERIRGRILEEAVSL